MLPKSITRMVKTKLRQYQLHTISRLFFSFSVNRHADRQTETDGHGKQMPAITILFHTRQRVKQAYTQSYNTTSVVGLSVRFTVTTLNTMLVITWAAGGTFKADKLGDFPLLYVSQCLKHRLNYRQAKSLQSATSFIPAVVLYIIPNISTFSLSSLFINLFNKFMLFQLKLIVLWLHCNAERLSSSCHNWSSYYKECLKMPSGNVFSQFQSHCCDNLLDPTTVFAM